MRKASAFVPGHISGFFQICDDYENPVKIGSRNCGICIDNGVSTILKAEEESSSRIEVFLNDEEASADTTKTAIRDTLKKFDLSCRVRVEHTVQAPLEAGYGMSGAGALGAVLAISEAFGLDMDRSDALKIAHEAEVKCKSGLGDVGPEMLGGVVIGLKPGGPPYGELERIETDEDLKVICGTLGSLSTSDFLDDLGFREKSKRLGGRAMDDLLREKSVRNFMRVSKEFALGLGAFEEEFIEILEGVSSASPLGASVVMLGRAIFSPVPSVRVEEVKSAFRDFFMGNQIMETSINFGGAKVLE